ncbi:MAG: GNAT family N-acetyltransferase [Actinobacteria bacterium]|nr:GNAT family N-acetyltransferase [Actinomycetota bacterium]
MSESEVRAIAAGDTYELRRALLRPHQRLNEMTWPADEHPDTLHAGAYRGERLVGIGTIHRQPMPGSAETEAWRIRGLAVEFGHRGYGLGAMLLGRLTEHATTCGGRMVWAHATAASFGFFEHYGFRRRGEPFELPESGPHYVVYAEIVR